MNILDTLLIFVGGPLAIYVLLGVFSMVPGRQKRHPGYKPGQPWDFPAQWWAGDLPVVTADNSELVASAEGGARGSW